MPGSGWQRTDALVLNLYHKRRKTTCYSSLVMIRCTADFYCTPEGTGSLLAEASAIAQNIMAQVNYYNLSTNHFRISRGVAQ
jgi:hypothetical protein